MKYLFIDTSALVVSCISTRSEHKIESFNVLKERLKTNEVKLLLPEVVRIEFERNIGTLSNMIKDAINSLETIVMKERSVVDAEIVNSLIDQEKKVYEG